MSGGTTQSQRRRSDGSRSISWHETSCIDAIATTMNMSRAKMKGRTTLCRKKFRNKLLSCTVEENLRVSSIRKLLPRHNRQSRQPRAFRYLALTLYNHYNSSSYSVVSIDPCLRYCTRNSHVNGTIGSQRSTSTSPDLDRQSCASHLTSPQPILAIPTLLRG